MQGEDESESVFNRYFISLAYLINESKEAFTSGNNRLAEEKVYKLHQAAAVLLHLFAIQNQTQSGNTLPAKQEEDKEHLFLLSHSEDDGTGLNAVRIGDSIMKDSLENTLNSTGCATDVKSIAFQNSPLSCSSSLSSSALTNREKQSHNSSDRHFVKILNPHNADFSDSVSQYNLKNISASAVHLLKLTISL
jgi:hypothetical protein